MQPLYYFRADELHTRSTARAEVSLDGFNGQVDGLRATHIIVVVLGSQAAKPMPLLTPRKPARIATWNIRTVYEAGRTAQVAREMKQYNICLLGLSETRWLQAGQLRLASGETLLYSGHSEEGAPHTQGVGLMLTPGAQRTLIGWVPVSSRIITAKFAIKKTKKKNIKLNVIQCYAPTNDTEDEKKED